MHSFVFPGYNGSTNDAKIEYIHNGIASASCAFETGECGAVRILLPRSLGVVSVLAEIYTESCSELIISEALEWCDLVDGFDAYEVGLDPNRLGSGLFFFKITVSLCDRRLYIEKQGSRVYLSESSFGIPHQLSVSDFAYSAPENKYGGVIYHIFVDRFRRGGVAQSKEGAVIVDDWSHGVPEFPEYPGAPLKNNTFYGGTLYGIIEKLDYIESLGVNTIYLSPIFDAASNHKYDTGNYMAVDEMFGGDEALVELIEAAKDRGIPKNEVYQQMLNE